MEFSLPTHTILNRSAAAAAAAASSSLSASRKSEKVAEEGSLYHYHHHHQQQQQQGLYQTSRWLCLLTTCIATAFLLGVGVGVAVPFWYSLPKSSIQQQQHSSMPSEALRDSPVIARLFPIFKNKNNSASSPTDSYADVIINQIGIGGRRGHSQFLNGIRANEKANEVMPILENVVSFIEPQRDPLTSTTAKDESDSHQSNPIVVIGSPITAITGEANKGIYWSQAVEDIMPIGFTDQNTENWRTFCKQSPVVRLEEGCGRMQNRLVTFENGTRSCCRYRQNYDQIQGEIFSFYLSRLLGLRNLPPSALGQVRSSDRKWTQVKTSLSSAQWVDDRPVVHTQFLDNLEPAYIPAQMRGSDRHLNPSDVRFHHLKNDSERSELIELAQWSDLLVLDYLTANLDRLVNNLYNMQWNPAMMDAPAHNLARDTRTGLLVFLDNESGLLHGYRLLDKYEIYHKSLLDSICIFRRRTIDALRQLQTNRNVGDLLRILFERHDQQLMDHLPFLPEKSIKTLNHRIDRVLEQVKKCQNVYGS